jgi:hypothetical protein
MADTKISALPASTTPLAGTEVLPIVQGGATVKVSVANLTAGRAISATAVTASTGNFIVGTSGQGIDFSATPGTGTSELLDDYEIGTWTPTLAGAGSAATLSTAIGRYTKVGNTVTVWATLVCSAAPTGVNVSVRDLPYTSTNTSNYFSTSATVLQNTTYTGSPVMFMNPNATEIFVCSQVTIGTLTVLSGSAFASNAEIIFSLSYTV